MHLKRILAHIPLVLCLVGCGYNPPTLQHVDLDLDLNQGSVPLKARLDGSFLAGGTVTLTESADSAIQATQGIIGRAVMVDGSGPDTAWVTFSYEDADLQKAEIPEDALQMVWYDRDGKNAVVLTPETKDTTGNQIRCELLNLGNYMLVDSRTWQPPETN